MLWLLILLLLLNVFSPIAAGIVLYRLKKETYQGATKWKLRAGAVVSILINIPFLVFGFLSLGAGGGTVGPGSRDTFLFFSLPTLCPSLPGILLWGQIYWLTLQQNLKEP